MHTRTFWIAAGMGLLLGSETALAGECTAGADETANISLLANELHFPTWGGGSAGLLEPFATVFQESLGIVGDTCGGECPFSTDYGAVTCGNLVEDPIDHDGVVEIAGVPNPMAFTEFYADLLPNARWEVGAQGFISPAAGSSHEARTTFANFKLGSRDVLDITSNGSGAQTIDVNLLMLRGDLGIVGCIGEILVVRAIPTVMFRLREDPVGPAPPEMLLDVDLSVLDYGSNPFQVEVTPPTVLYIDFFLSAGVNATGDNFTSEDLCAGGNTTLDFRPPSNPNGPTEGFQIFLSGSPQLTIVPRSGIDYQPVPEPTTGGGAVVAAMVALRSLLRRRGRCDRARSCGR